MKGWSEKTSMMEAGLEYVPSIAEATMYSNSQVVTENERIAGRKAKGTLLKGSPFKANFNNHICKASFPSKFETQIFKRDEKLGFGSKLDRFSNNNASLQDLRLGEEEEKIGPGYYNVDAAGSAKKSEHSFSKKGFGNGFVSRSKRFTGSLKSNSIDYFYE